MAYKNSIKKKLDEAGKRALKEALARKEKERKISMSPEVGGRNGPEPTRFGDWEKKGIVSDFQKKRLLYLAKFFILTFKKIID